jgi:hypothetical protein
MVVVLFCTPAGVQKSLLFLENSVVRTAGNAQGNKRLAKLSARCAGWLC